MRHHEALENENFPFLPIFYFRAGFFAFVVKWLARFSRFMQSSQVCTRFLRSKDRGSPSFRKAKCGLVRLLCHLLVSTSSFCHRCRSRSHQPTAFFVGARVIIGERSEPEPKLAKGRSWCQPFLISEAGDVLKFNRSFVIYYSWIA